MGNARSRGSYDERKRQAIADRQAAEAEILATQGRSGKVNAARMPTPEDLIKRYRRGVAASRAAARVLRTAEALKP